MSQTIHCSFCNLSSKKVKFLVNGNDVYICDDCVAVCVDILHKQGVDIATPEADVESSLDIVPTIKKRKFSPKAIRNYLDQYVIGQEDAKIAISVAVSNHYKRLENNDSSDGIEIDKTNVLIVGPTGSGKTLIAQSIARFLDVPLAIADATSLTEAGYIGEDVESILTRLYQAAGNNIEKAERGIIYIDEIDKKAKREGSSGRDVSGEGVQQALLKIIEGAEVVVPTQGKRNSTADTVRINTKNILFIVGGSFVGIEKLMNVNEGASIGFGATTRTKPKTDFSKIQPEHLAKFGLIPEIIGRLPVITGLNELDLPAMIRIMTEPKNAIVKQYVKLFAMDGITLRFEQDALEEIAKIAQEKKTGARGLRSVIEARLTKIQYNLSDMFDDGVEEVIVTKDTVVNGAEPTIVAKTISAVI